MPSNTFPALILLLSLAACVPGGADPEPEAAVAFEPDVKGPSSEAGRNLRHFRTADHLVIDLVAAEPFLANPVSFDIDVQGDIYVTETFRLHQGVTDMRRNMSWLEEDLANRTVQDRLETMRRNLGEDFESSRGATDRIKLIRDSDGDGVHDTHTVFADGFDDYLSGIGSGVLVDGRDVYYTNIPDLWKLRDSDGDGQADSRESLSRGYGVRFAFYGHDLHGLIRGPDGKIYFSIGDRGLHVETPQGPVSYPDEGVVLRCNPDGSDLEVVHRGLRNPQELAFDDYGNFFTGDNNSDAGDLARWVQVVEGGDSGWRVGYQYLTKPIPRGPWNLERLWLPHFEGQAAYIVPPVANIGAGPSGLAYYPGTGLPEKYQGHFFLCDFRGNPASIIHSFRVRPRGATFELVDRQDFATGALFTDVDFGPTPGLFFSDWVRGWGSTGKGRIYRAYDPVSAHDPLVEETARLLAQDFGGLEDTRLAGLLAHRDQRIRLRAQFALAEKGAQARRTLHSVLETSDSRLAQIHAMWALGQLGRAGVSVAGDLIDLTQDSDAEVCAQAARLLGDLSSEAVPALIGLLQDDSFRIKSLSALSLGKIGSEEAVGPLLKMIREAGIEDPYLRHGAVMGLSGCARAGDLVQLAADPSPAVRMSALLALRRLADPGVSRFLRDALLEIVTAAARAIYDVPIESALPKLAALIGEERFLDLAPAAGLEEEALTAYRDQEVLAGDDGSLRFTLPLLLRVVNANWRVGKSEHAQALTGLAGNREVHWLLRGESLRRLTQWDGDAVLDPLLGVYRPFSSNPARPAREAAVALYERLLEGEREDLLGATMALVGHYEIDQAAPALVRLARSREKGEPIRSAALEALSDIGGPTALETVLESLDSPSSRLRAVALRMLARLDPSAVTSRIEKTLREGEMLEKQAALELLSELGTTETQALLLVLMEELQEKTLDPAIQLDVLEACGASKVPEIQARAAGFEEQAEQWDDFGLYRTAIAGGDERIGRAVFFFNSGADCKRCHVINEVGGGMVGPDLTDVNERLTREEILESVVYPNRTIAEGYETVDIILKDGRDFSGRVLREDEEKLVLEQDISFYEFESEDGLEPHSQVDVIAEEVPSPLTEEVVIPKQNIRIRRSSQSGMPEDVVDSLQLPQLRDLIAFLANEKE